MPGAGNALQDLGGGSRTVSGRGVFTGETCREDFERLAAVFSEEGAGQLLLPGIAPFPAVFSSLTMKGDSRPNCIGYEFAFLEDGTTPEHESVVSERKTRVCTAEDTLFGIAAEAGVSVDALVALNPGVQWPNAPGEGTEVVIVP